MSMKLRTATPEDADALGDFAARVFSENFGHLYKPEDLAAHLVKSCSACFFTDCMKQDTVLLAMDGEYIAGYTKVGAVGLPVRPHPENSGEIHRLYIDVPYQGRGVGHMLMKAALQLPILAQSSHIYLGVWENNHRAQAMYRSYGFAPVGEYLYYVGDHADREIIMMR